MHRVDTSTAAAAKPASDAAGTPGYFTKGDPVVPTAATVPGQDWFNAVQEELVALIEAAGLSPDTAKADFAQVSKAALILARGGAIGFRAKAQDPAALSLDIEAGAFFNATTGQMVTVAATTVGPIAAPGADPRHDIVYIDALTGAVGIATGVEDAAPVDPAIPAGKLPIRRINAYVGMTEIADADLDELRYLSGAGMGGYAAKNPAVLAKAAAYTITQADNGKLIEADATGGAFSVTALAVADAGNGFSFGVKKTDASANAVTVDGDGAETIDGAASRALATQYLVEWYRCDGVGWHLEGTAALAATGAFETRLLHVRDEQASGVLGGTSTSTTWHTRDINTEKTNELAGCGLAWELAYDAQTTNFTVGQTLTGGTSGATATIVADSDAGATGTLKVINITGVFVDNETITDGVGGSATSDIVGGVVAANQIYLAAATYWIEAISVQSDSYNSRLRLRDVDGAATVLSGINGGSQGGTGTNDSNLLFGVFTLASGKLLEFQLWIDTGRTSDGLGKAVSSGDVEVYTSAMIWKRT